MKHKEEIGDEEVEIDQLSLSTNMLISTANPLSVLKCIYAYI